VANLFHNGSDPTFADLYRHMSELELQDLLSDWHSLIPEARSALAAEFATRGLEFIEPPPPTGDTPPEFRDLTTIRRYRDLSEALVARAVIESAGIFCFLKDENLVRLDWQVSNFIGGIRLQVAAADVEAASDILSQPIPNEISIPDQPRLHSASLSPLHLDRYHLGASRAQSRSRLSLPVLDSPAARLRVLALQQLQPALDRR
jgi:Putative prokaryotic signal transducing protein